jgi:nucleoside-diphosphate-sugar epimerase
VRVIVAGGAGFIGSHLCRRLVGDGHSVVAVDNLVTGRLDNVADLVGSPSFEFVEHDIVRPLSIDGPVDLICHLASPASPSDFLRMPIEILEVGSAGTKQMLELARANNARFLFTSTSEVYGDPLVHPQPESYFGNVDPIGPRACYDESKRYAEALTMAYRRMHAVDAVIVRIFNTYGPSMRPDDGRVLSTFIQQALTGEPLTLHGDGSHTRSYCYVADQVDGLLAAAASGAVGPFNVGSVAEFSVREVAEMVVRLTGSSSPIVTVPLPPERAGDPQRRQPDLSRTRAECGWEPKVSLAEGLALMIDAARTEMCRPNAATAG